MTKWAAAPPTMTNRRWPDLLAAAAGILFLIIAGVAFLPPTELGPALVKGAIRLALAGYFTAILLKIGFDTADWRAETVRGKTARNLWTWAIVWFVIHVCMAFHFYHDWSPRKAFEHTRAVSGVGEGIYASYFFMWLWIADALWWRLWPQSYAARSVWYSRALHAFMIFIVFNGVVVFEAGLIRAVGGVVLPVVAIAWFVIPRAKLNSVR